MATVLCGWRTLPGVQWALLEGVPAEEVRELSQIARRRRFARNEVVFHQDDPVDSLHLIETGRFAVRVATSLGEVATIAVRGPGESFGEMALLADDPRRSATVAALEPAETFAVYRTGLAATGRRPAQARNQAASSSGDT